METQLLILLQAKLSLSTYRLKILSHDFAILSYKWFSQNLPFVEYLPFVVRIPVSCIFISNKRLKKRRLYLLKFRLLHTVQCVLYLLNIKGIKTFVIGGWEWTFRKLSIYAYTLFFKRTIL